MDSQVIAKIYSFGAFRLDTARRLLQRNTGATVPLTPKACELLLLLVENQGQLLTKPELMNRLWPDSFVEEGNLTQTISVLRKALGENPRQHQYIVTVPGQGYRFVAAVNAAEEGADEGKWGKILLEESSAPEARPSDSEATLQVAHFKNESPVKNASSQPKTRLLWLAVPLVVLLAVGAYWFFPRPQPVGLRDIKTIAVLPFEDLSVEQTEKYLGVSLADALTNKFGELQEITVRPTRSVLKYADNRADVGQIGRELQVDAVLDGRIQHVGERVRISVQLIRTSDNATLWTGNFDDQFTNFFAVQDSISQKVAQSLAVQMSEKDRTRFSRRTTENAAAYQDYLRGRYLWNQRTAESLNKAAAQFEQAMQKDPSFALAYAGLANCYVLLAEYHAVAPHDIFPKAKTVISQALELDDQSAEAYAALGYMQAFYEWDYPSAEASFKRAIDLNPSYATAYQWYSELLVALGRFDEFHAHIERAIEIDPVSPVMLAVLAAFYDLVGDYENEIKQARKILELDPNFAYGHFYLGMGYERKGLDAEASETLAQTMTLFGEPPECAEEVRAAFRRGGLRGWWQKRLEQIETRPHLKYFQPSFKAMVQIRLGDKEGTLASLNRAFQVRDRNLILLKYEPRFAPLRDDPRFQELLREMKLNG